MAYRATTRPDDKGLLPPLNNSNSRDTFTVYKLSICRKPFFSSPIIKKNLLHDVFDGKYNIFHLSVNNTASSNNMRCKL